MAKQRNIPLPDWLYSAAASAEGKAW